ncbi:hypothetical protein ACA910_004413 [Epithemia clementina (nom. ined.)]
MAQPLLHTPEYERFQSAFCSCANNDKSCEMSDFACLSQCAMESGKFNLVVMLELYGLDDCQDVCGLTLGFVVDDAGWCDDSCTCVWTSCKDVVPDLEFPACTQDCFCTASDSAVNGQGGLFCTVAPRSVVSAAPSSTTAPSSASSEP